MSTIYLDLGNTSLKIYSDKGVMLAAFSTLDEEWPLALADFVSTSHSKRMVLASVASQEKLDVVLTCFAGLDINIAACMNGDWEVEPGYSVPTELGIDRLLAMEAAYRLTRTSVVVIDCGSAITVDGISSEGVHLGGFIVPGYRLQLESLMGKTALKFGDRTPELNLGLNTTSCIQNGVLRMVMDFCQGVIHDINPERVFITGGDIKGALAELVHLGEYDELLVYKGMKYVYG